MNDQSSDQWNQSINQSKSVNQSIHHPNQSIERHFQLTFWNFKFILAEFETAGFRRSNFRFIQRKNANTLLRSTWARLVMTAVDRLACWFLPLIGDPKIMSSPAPMAWPNAWEARRLDTDPVKTTSSMTGFQFLRTTGDATTSTSSSDPELRSIRSIIGWRTFRAIVDSNTRRANNPKTSMNER